MSDKYIDKSEIDINDCERHLEFIQGMQDRGFTVEENFGLDDSVFFSLALIVWGTHNYHEQMRFWIVEWLRAFPQRYNTIGTHQEFVEHCAKMDKEGTPATCIEL